MVVFLYLLFILALIMSSFEALSDNELLELITSGDRNAFSEIYNRYWKKLLSVAVNKIDELEEAEEIVQDIFISFWERRQKLEITASLNAYLAVSVKYRVLKVLAKRSQHLKYADHSFKLIDPSVNSTEEWLEFEELKSRLQILVSNLPEKCRLVYQLSREQGFSQKEIAKECSISEKTVEAHLGKALKSLRTGLGRILL